MTLVDTHAHLDQQEFDSDRAAVIERASGAGVKHVIGVSVGLQSSLALLKLAGDFPGMHVAVGVHPNYTHEAQSGDWDQICALARQPRVVALGETGLDRYRDYAPFALQQDYFERHIRLSQETGLPFIVHARDSLPDILEMLRAARVRGPLTGVMHSYTGDIHTARECIDLGLYVSFAGMLTFKKSQELRAVATEIPADRLLVETDSPYLSPEPFRGKRNEPAHVVHTAARLAEARSTSVEVIARITTANARRLFRLPE
ncbi:MAG: TatD family hydrolase [Pirellulales bacterium]|nr:TatD family hydrolase [Pirellulales bacterium]